MRPPSRVALRRGRLRLRALRFGEEARRIIGGYEMARFTPDQFAFAASRRHYLNRDDAIDFLKQMDIRMAVGHWSAGDFCDRFAPPGYHSDDPSFRNDFEGQCRRIKAAGVNAVEIHQSVFEKTLNGDLEPM